MLQIMINVPVKNRQINYKIPTYLQNNTYIFDEENLDDMNNFQKRHCQSSATMDRGKKIPVSFSIVIEM